MKKKVLAIMMCLAMGAALLVGCGDGGSSNAGNTGNDGSAGAEVSGDYEWAEDIYLVSSDFAAEDNAIAINTRFFIDALVELSDGHIQVEENFGGTLAGSMAAFETISTGVADFGTISPLFNPSDLPLSQISTCVPFGTTEGKVAADVMNSVMNSNDAFAQEYANAGLKCLYAKGTESYTLISNKATNSISDLKGQVVAVGGTYYPSWFEAIGAITTAADSTAAYQNLKTNVYTYFWAFDSSYAQYSLNEVCDNIYDMNGGARCTQALVFNADTYNALDPYVQGIIDEAAQISYDKYNAWLADQMDGWRTSLEDAGVTYTQITDADKTAWAEAIFAGDTNSIQTWIDTVTAAGCDGAAIMSDYLKAMTDAGVEYPYDVEQFIQ